MLRKFSILALLLGSGCVKSFTVASQSYSGFKTQMSIQPSTSSGDYLHLTITNLTDSSMFVKWDKTTLSVMSTSDDSAIILKSGVVVVSKNQGHSDKSKVMGTSMISSGSKNRGAYAIFPKTELVGSNYQADTKGHIFSPETIKSSESGQLELITDICFGELENGILPSKCASGGEGWKKTKLVSNVTLVNTSM